MREQLATRLTYSNVMSTLAVFLIVSGGIAIAASLPKNSVGKKQLKTSAVVTKKLKKNAVTGAKANESTFGEVPLASRARQADTATKADSATRANTAGSATSADSATTALDADDSSLLQGLGLADVRPAAAAASSAQTTPVDGATTVLTTPIQMPPGPGRIIANASVRLTADAGSIVGCYLASTLGIFSNEGTVKFESTSSHQLALTGSTALPADIGNLPIGLNCARISGTNVSFQSGELTVLAIPTG